MKRFILAMLVVICYATPSFGQWSYQDGFVKYDGERFFAVGTWGVYGLAFHYGNYTPTDSTLFADTINEHFNIAYVPSPGKCMNFNDDIKYLLGSKKFQYDMTSQYGDNYTARIDLYNPSDDGIAEILSYDEVHSLKSLLQSDPTALNAYYDEMIDSIYATMGDKKFIWSQMDECDRNRSGWAWLPDILNKFKERILVEDDEAVVFTSFARTTQGNRYFYDTLCGNPYTDPSYEDYYLRNSDNTDGSAFNLTKVQGNTVGTAAAYEATGDIFGLNDYINFKNYPYLAGDITNYLKWGTDVDNPVWLYFNTCDLDNQGTGYASVRCQIYTAITQGCTGVLFFSEGATEPQFNNATGLADSLLMLQNYGVNGDNILTADCQGNGVLPSGAYYLVRLVSGENNHRYLILTNPTDSPMRVYESEIDNFSIDGNQFWDLDPMDVLVVSNLGTEIISKPAISLNEENKFPEPYSISVSPNPFNPTTTISYAISNETRVNLNVYSVSGQLVSTLVDELQAAGEYAVTLNGADLTSGIYLYTFKTDEYQTTGKMTLMK